MFAKSYRIRAMAESQVKLQQSSVRVLPGSLKPTVKIEPTLIKYPGTTTYSKNSQETEKFCQKILELKNLQDIGFDMEWKVSFVRNQPQPKTALVQLCYETDANQYSCLCAHVFYTGVPPSLQKILENNEIKKVGVNILNDASKFQRDFGIQINGCVELMNEARSRILDEGATIAYTGKTNMQTLVLKVFWLNHLFLLQELEALLKYKYDRVWLQPSCWCKHIYVVIDERLSRNGDKEFIFFAENQTFCQEIHII
eukprot:TRINITY_DN31569_c0_g4_i1.p1 TRINITY_DN31569_c0_g4~~TRINITY_DN31569_c0_g4_i1.p1  ORF type:complete len:255 (+),score=17.32 TRINITY_DN31569_c0_g4_i1:164-928(+)